MIQNAKILQRQDTRANLEAVKRNNFIAFDTDANHLLYCKDGNNWFDFYNASEVESKFLNLSSLYLPQSGIDASKVTSGVFDIARIPVLPSQVQVASSGDLTALTSSQQTQIGQGTVVTTTDGFRWVYSGAGSKTTSASYTQLADITPDWTVISNKPTNVSTWFNDSGYLTSSSSLAWAKLTGLPSSFTPSTHVHAISDVTGLQVALDGKQAAGSYLTTSYVPTWSSVTGKPTAVSTWTNDSGYLTASSLLTGFVTGANTAITATDSVLSAFQKLQGQLNSKQASGSYLTSSYVPAWSTVTGKPTTLAGYGITDAQAALGFTPVRQGGGSNQLSNTILIGWSSVGTLRLQIDATDFGATWPISINGSANAVPWSGVTGKPTTLSGYGISDAAICTGAYTATDAWTRQLNPGIIGSVDGNPANLTNNPNGSWNNPYITFGSSSNRLVQIAGDYVSNQLFFRRNTDGTWNGWNNIWHSGNLIGDQSAHYHSADRAWGNITSKPTTLAGYGMTNNATAGNAKIGYWSGSTGFARFGHSSADNGSNYGYLQDASGNCWLQGAIVRLGSGADLVTIQSTGITFDTPATFNKPIYTGKAFVHGFQAMTTSLQLDANSPYINVLAAASTTVVLYAATEGTELKVMFMNATSSCFSYNYPVYYKETNMTISYGTAGGCPIRNHVLYTLNYLAGSWHINW